MMVTQGHVASTKTIVPFIFQLSNFSNTNGTLTTTNSDVQEYWIPRKGSIIGVSGSLSAALTTGTLTITPYIDGSASAIVSNAFHLSQQAFVERYNARTQFRSWKDDAGHALGLRYTSSDTVNPTTLDGVLIVEVLLEDVSA